MGDTANKISIKLLVDKENNKVVFAEAGEYFVKVLLCYLSLPIGLVSKYSNKKSMVGCIDALYKSVGALDIQYFQTKDHKDMFFNPKWPCPISTKIHYLYKIYGVTKCCGVDHKITSVDENEMFMITDDLHVKKVSIETGVQILSQMGITDVSVLEEKITSFTIEEPTDEIIKNTKKKIKTEPLDKQFLSLEQTVRNSIEKISLKLLICKSKNKVVYAVANAEFVDLLFSILAFPWETMIELFCGCSSLGSMDNLYKSEEKLCVEYPEQFTKDKKIPFNPKHKGGYVKATTIFMVTDELTVEPFSLVSSISFINKLDVPLSDLEERTAAVGEQEALSIVKDSLTTTTPLTNVFCKKK